MNFLETLLHPDREEAENKERALIASAANLLQVGEFQLLQLAYRQWHGRDLPEVLIDRLFASYMMRDKVPHWARHYARGILEGEELGEIDDRNPAFHRYDHDYHTSVPRGALKFACAVAILFLFIGGGLVVAERAATSAAGPLPPYFDQKNLPSGRDTFTWGRSDTIPPDAGISAKGGQP